jgi:hypothetical protein
MHYKTPFSHNGYIKSLEIYENYITLFCLEKNKLFDNIIRTMHGILPKVVELTIQCKQQLRNNTILSHAPCLGMHSNVMQRFMAQTFQDPPLCSSTRCCYRKNCCWYYRDHQSYHRRNVGAHQSEHQQHRGPYSALDRSDLKGWPHEIFLYIFCKKTDNRK